MASYVICQFRKIMTEIRFKELGLIEYTETYDAMMQLIESQPSFHSIWSLEHYPVSVSYTHLTLPTTVRV